MKPPSSLQTVLISWLPFVQGNPSFLRFYSCYLFWVLEKCRKYIRLISFANISVHIVLTNITIASSDIVSKPLMCLIAFRQYSEDSLWHVIHIHPVKTKYQLHQCDKSKYKKSVIMVRYVSLLTMIPLLYKPHQTITRAGWKTTRRFSKSQIRQLCLLQYGLKW